MAKEAPKQYLFISNRTVNVGSTQGYSILFEKGVPTHVPPGMHAEVMARGILPCTADGETLDSPEVADPTPESKVVLAPEDAETRNAKILEVVREVAKRNNPKDYTAGGVPTAAAVTMALGWRVDQKEVTAVWRANKRDILGLGDEG